MVPDLGTICGVIERYSSAYHLVISAATKWHVLIERLVGVDYLVGH